LSDKILAVRDYNLDIVLGKKETVRALSGINFSLERGQTLGLIGETGCGKTLTAKSVISLLPKIMKPSGEIVLDGTNLLNCTESELVTIRRRKIGYIPQNAMNSLDPLFSVRDQMYEVIGGEIKEKSVKEEKCRTALRNVELDPDKVLRMRPFELSGGMLQRVLLAMALVRDPALIIADEITTALDVVTQIKILKLMRRLQEENGLSLLVITHDMRVASALCHEICVMYLGRIVEYSTSESLLNSPKHPYTQALLKAKPRIGATELVAIQGTVPGLGQMPTGCKFHPRCPYSFEMCPKVEPRLLLSNGTKVACHLYKEDP
jgi:peptide/nickel transport system ATP-binding protein